jgi:hypothetical protein
MPNEKSKKRFLSIRLTPEEFKEVYRQCEISNCRSLTEYAKKALMRTPPIPKERKKTRRDRTSNKKS